MQRTVYTLVLMWTILHSLFFFITLSFPLVVRQQPLNDNSTQQFDPTPYREYFDLATKYWGANSGRASECLQYTRQYGWTFTGPSLFNVGLEGSGHHMMLEMDSSLPPQGHGGAVSFSSCSTCKGPYAWRLNASKESFNPYLNNTRTGKFLVLLRDPVDSFHSALRRFWHPEQWPTDTFDKELDELNKSMALMERRLRWISCAKTVFISYELLTHFPDAHVHLFANLLKVNPDHKALQRWFNRLRKRARDYDALYGNASLLVGDDRIGPFFVPCSSELGERLRRFAWPKNWAKDDCSSDAECERAFHEVSREWAHPALRELYPSIIPRHHMSECAAVDTAEAARRRV